MINKNQQYTELLNKQIGIYNKETKYLEFKSNYQNPEKLGEYISALSNGACLEGEDFGYLYFGIEDTTLAIKGTKFDFMGEKAKGNQSLELTLRREITPKINFKIEEFFYQDTFRIVRFKIPAAQGEPTLYNWKPYGRIDSHTTLIQQYPDWMRALYNSQRDWSCEVIENATIDDLDPEAIQLARKGYKQRYPDFAKECDDWIDEVFLDKAALTLDGQITRTTMLLVGKRESVHKIPHISQIIWSCVEEGETFGDIFTIPFIISTTSILNRIRNYRFKIYPYDSLIPAEVWKYDTRSILEGLHNCIAHQDYTLNERILVEETKNKITFENAGNFFAGSYEEYIEGKKRPRKYRNKALMNAMVSIKMIDSQGYGIHNLFVRQRERFLPMPDYEGSTEDRVVLNMPGIVIDIDYSLLLMKNSTLSLTEAYLLDRVQKRHPISENAIKMLRKKNLVEGKRPNVYLAKSLSQRLGKKVEYSKHKGLDENSCWHSLYAALRDHHQLTRAEINDLLFNNLSDQLTIVQKDTKIRHLLTKWKNIDKKLDNVRKGNLSVWMLHNPLPENPLVEE